MCPKGKGSGKTPARVVELLKMAIAEKGQVGVASESGLTRLAVQRYLKGISEPTTSSLDRLSKYFKVPVWWLRIEEPIEADLEEIRILHAGGKTRLKDLSVKMGVNIDDIMARLKSLGVEVKSAKELIEDEVDDIIETSKYIYDSPIFKNIAMIMVSMTEEERDQALNSFKEQLESEQKLKNMGVTLGTPQTAYSNPLSRAMDEVDKKEEGTQ